MKIFSFSFLECGAFNESHFLCLFFFSLSANENGVENTKRDKNERQEPIFFDDIPCILWPYIYHEVTMNTFARTLEHQDDDERRNIFICKTLLMHSVTCETISLCIRRHNEHTVRLFFVFVVYFTDFRRTKNSQKCESRKKNDAKSSNISKSFCVRCSVVERKFHLLTSFEIRLNENGEEDKEKRRTGEMGLVIHKTRNICSHMCTHHSHGHIRRQDTKEMRSSYQRKKCIFLYCFGSLKRRQNLKIEKEWIFILQLVNCQSHNIAGVPRTHHF